MKTQEEIKTEIASIENNYRHVLTGSVATVQINAARAHWKRIADNPPVWFRPAGQSIVHPTQRDSDGGAMLTRGQT